MRPLPLLLAAAIAPALAPAQTIYRCTSPQGAVTYQETPCADGGQKRVDTAHGAAARGARREALEREAVQGLSLDRALDAQARERQEASRSVAEARAHAERMKRLKEPPPAAEDVPWNPPWGFPARPGLARPKDRDKAEGGAK